MIAQFAFSKLGPLSVVAWGGIFTYSLLLLTAFISVSNKKGLKLIPQKWHSRVAILTVVSATLHGGLVILASL